MDYIQSVKTCFKKYATFSGRASRSEFWYFVLFYFIFFIVTALLDAAFFHGMAGNASSYGPFNSIFVLITLLPYLAVTVRRLHDVDHSGWWILIGITVIGALFPLFYWYCSQGTQGSNRFGANTN